MLTNLKWASPHLHPPTQRIWCNYLIMMRLFVEAWLRGGVWQLVMSLPHNTAASALRQIYSIPIFTRTLCTDAALATHSLYSSRIPHRNISIKTSSSVSTVGYWLTLQAWNGSMWTVFLGQISHQKKKRGERTWQRASKGLRRGRQKKRQAKIQAQAVNPEGASLTVDEGGSFVDRCSA